MLVKAGHSFVLAVLPSTSWIDLARLSEVLGSPVSDVRLATPDELFEIFNDCEPGVVPPFGRLYGLTTLVDSGLTESAEIVLGANTRHEGLRMRFRDFQALRGARAGVVHATDRSLQPSPGEPARGVDPRLLTAHTRGQIRN